MLKIWAGIIVAAAIILFSNPVDATGFNHTSAKAAILVDYDTGMILFEKNADEKMPTSSMSKVMTAYVIFQALEEGALRLDTKLPVSEKAWRKGGSKMFVEVDSRVKVEDLLKGVIVQSGNDATIVLAEGLSGSEDAFAEALNQTAKSIGMNNSNFKNASGWPDPLHYSTARDLSTLGVRLIKDFPEYYRFYSETEYSYNNIKQNNRNPLLYRGMGADGIKTGYTEAGGYGLIGSGTRNGRRVVLVINGLKDDKARAQESARMLEWGLKAFENIELFSANEIVDQADVIMGKKALVPLMVKDRVFVTVPSSIKNDLKVELVYEGPIQAPVKQGEQIGTLKVEIPRIKAIEIPLYAAEDVNNLGFFATPFAKAKLLLSGTN